MNEVSLPRETMAILRDCIARDRPMSPSHAATLARIASADPGSVRVTVPIPRDSPEGARVGVLVATDAALGGAVTSAFATSGRVATLQMHVQFVGGLAGGQATASAHTKFVDDVVGTAVGELCDDDGWLMATMATRCARVPGQQKALSDRRPRSTGHPPKAYVYQESASVLDLLDMGTEAGPDGVRLTAVADPGLSNLGGAVQGGVLAAVAAIAMEALFERNDGGYDLTVDYVRSIKADGRNVSAHAVVEHGGRSLQLAQCTVSDDAGRVAVRARMSRYQVVS